MDALVDAVRVLGERTEAHRRRVAVERELRASVVAVDANSGGRAPVTRALAAASAATSGASWSSS